jgi:hypothetical protein
MLRNFPFKPGDLITVNSSHPKYMKWLGMVIDIEYRRKLVEKSRFMEKLWLNAYYPPSTRIDDVIYVAVLGPSILNMKKPLKYQVFISENLKKVEKIKGK